MPAWLDQLLVLGAVLGATGYFIRRWLRKRRKGAGCGGGCGCAFGKRITSAYESPNQPVHEPPASVQRPSELV